MRYTDRYYLLSRQAFRNIARTPSAEFFRLEQQAAREHFGDLIVRSALTSNHGISLHHLPAARALCEDRIGV